MLKKLFALTFAVLVLVATLTSCKIFNKNPGGGNDNAGDTATSHAIFSPEISINLVKGSGAKDLNDAANRIYDLTGRIAGVITGTTMPDGNEIIFGKAEARPIVDVAEQKLQALVRRATLEFEDAGKDVNRLGVFVIYAEGGSVVMLWNNNNIAESAVEFFMENYMTNTKLVLEDGYTYSESFDFVEFMEKAEDTQRQKYLDEIAKQYDDEVARAVDSLWSIVDDRYVLWLADLYDPGEYDEDGNPKGGGFYYSNSARDNNGYGIDLESTAQILSFMTSSGMLPNRNGVLREYFPEKMQKEMLAFALSCQSPIDGCFYHPQWGMNIQESRKSRDHGWALDILTAFGGKPYFNSDLGIKNGIYGDPPGYEVDVDEYIESLTSPTALTNRLGSSSVSAVSKVVTVSSDEWTGSAMFKDLDAWIKYLEALESTIRTKSYSIGNTVSGLATQAKNREKMALEKGELFDNDGDGYADGGYREQFRNYFNKWMLPENGVWEYGTVEEGTITYASINGLMKTIGAYNGFGFKHPYAEKAIESALFIATLDGPDVKGADASASVDVFNPFVAIELTLNNMKNYGSNEEAIAINNMIKERAAEVINITREKIVDFKKDDGSFGYTKTVSPSTSQGAPTSVPYTVEGDVNGGGIATNGVTRYIRSIFDISMPLFYRSDFYRFIERASGNSAVLKGQFEDKPASVVSFDDDTTEPSSVINNMKDGDLSIVDDPRGTGKVMQFVTYPTSGSSFSVNPGGPGAANSFVLEWEMCFEDVKHFNGTLFQIKIGSSYMFTCGVNTSGRLVMGDSSSTNAPLTSSFNVAEAKAYEWNKIRLEYYVVDPDSGETLTKFYFNDQLRGVSTNYMGKETAGKMPVMSYTAATFSALFATNMTVLFDNVYAAKSEEKYEAETIFNPDRVKDFEDAELGTVMPSGVTSDKGEIVNVPTDENADNKALLLDGEGEAAQISVTAASATANVYVLSTDMKIETSAVGAITKIYFVDMAAANRAIAGYEIETYNDGIMKAKITEIDLEGNKGKTFDGIPVGEWFNLTIEFYVYRYLDGDCAKIYVNGEHIGTGSTWGGIDTISRQYKYFYIVNSLDAKIYLDNVIPEKDEKIFTDADGNEIADPDVKLPLGGESSKVAAEDNHDGHFDFEDQELGTPSVAGLQTKVNGAEYGNNMDIAEDPKDAANKVLVYKTMVASNGLANSMIFTASKDSPAGANCHVFEFDMLIGNFSGTMQISLNGSYSGNEQKIFNTNCSANMNKGTFTIAGKTEAVSWPGGIVSATPFMGWVKVRLEYYKDKGIMQVYYDGEYRGESDLVWNEANKAASLTHVTVYTTRDTNCELFFDNVVVESIKKEYVKGTPLPAGTPAGSEKDDNPGQGGGSTTPDTPDTPDKPDTPVITESYTGFTDFEKYQTGTFAVPGIGLTKLSSTSAYAMVMEDPRDAAGKVLEFYAKGWKNKIVVDIKENEAEVHNMMSASWDMDFTDVAADSTYQIFFGSNGEQAAYVIQMTVTKSGTVKLRDINTTSGSASYRKETFIADLSAGWHSFRLDYVVDGDTCAANIWIDGYFVTTSTNFYNFYGTRTTPDMIYDQIIISATNSVNAHMWLDNISANYVTEVEAPLVYEGNLDFENENLGETKMLGFASGFENPVGYAKVVSDPRDAAAKVLEFYAKGTKSYVQTVIYDGESESRDRARISWDMYFPSVTAGSTYQISLGYDGSDRTFMLQISAKTDGTYSVSAIASTGWQHAKTVKIAEGLSGWHNLVIEMEVIDGEFMAVAYVDGDYAATCYNFYNYNGAEGALPKAIGKYVRFSTTSNVDATMMLDNMVAKYVDEIKAPPTYEGVLNFEYYDVDKYMILGMSTSFESSEAYAKVASDPRAAAEKVLAFYAKGTKNYVQTNMYDLSDGDKTKARISWDMNFETINASTTYQLSLGYDGSDRTYMMQMTVYTSGKVTLTDISSTNSAVKKTTAITSGLAAGWHNVCVEMEIVDGVFTANIYIDDEFVVTSHNFYNYNGAEGAAPRAIGKYVRFSSTSGSDATMLLDNVVSTYVKEIKTPPVFEGTNDFEYYDEGKSFVLGTSFELSNATLAVASDPVKAANKVFKFATNGSGNALTFDVYGEKTNSVAVEFDMMFTDVTVESHFQLSIGGSYTLQITPLKSGKYQITDRNDVTVWSGEHYKSKNFTGGHTVSCGEWHRIRIEYSIDGTTCLAKVYLDGTLLGESDHFYNYKGERTSPLEIGDYVTFRSTGGCDAVVWFDNVTTVYVQ